MTARAQLKEADVPRAPFLGPRTLRDKIDVRELWPCFDLKSLYRLSWGGANVKGEAWEALVRDEFEPRLHSYQQRAKSDGLLAPRVVYGYFPASAEGDDILVYVRRTIPDGRSRASPLRAKAGGEHLCLADYLRESRTVARRTSLRYRSLLSENEPVERIDQLQAQNEYTEAYFLHGFTVQTAEALAEHTHRRIRAELGLPAERGKRYSWGYGACPDLAQHELVWELLDVEKAIGARLTSAFQIVPEQSTAAIIIHHPQAAYFNAGAVRELIAS